MKRLLIALILVIPAVASAEIRISLEYTTAEKTLALLSNPNATAADARQLLELPPTRAMIKHAQEFDPHMTEDVFVATIVAAAHGQKPSPDPFGWSNIIRNMTGARAILQAIQSDPNAFSADVASRIAAYAPKDITLAAKVFAIVGGGSDGFAPGDQTFYIAVDMFRGELDAAKLMTTHELYHLVQEAMRGPESSAKKPLVHDLMQSVLDEGTADLVADPLKIKGGGSWMEWYRGKYQRNLDRIGVDFALLDTLLYRAKNDSGATEQLLYPVGFSGMLDSPCYFVGYRMAGVIDKRMGRAKLIELVGRDPAEFFRAYLSVASADDPQFTDSVKQMVATR